MTLFDHLHTLSRAPRLTLASLLGFALLYLTSLTPSQSAAQGSRIFVEVDREAISLRQTTRATVTISLDGVSSQADVMEPSWRDSGWSVLSRSSSTSLSFINGQRSLEVTKTYQLKPVRKGELTVGPFKGRGTARGLSSNSVKVKVTDKPPPMSAKAQQKNRRYVQIKWDVDQREVWLGEPITATLTVYVLNRLNLVDIEAPSINLKGFWSRELDPPRRSARVELGGRIYYQQIIKRDHLTPLKAGDLELPEPQMTVTVGTQRLFSENHQIDVRVDPVKIKVKPLPSNAPLNFKGPAVGEVKLTATLDRHRVRQDESVQLIIKTSTTGMLNNTPQLELPYLDGVRSYPPTVREVTQSVNGEERMVRVQTWLLKPERAGEIKIPSMNLPYFHPLRGQYANARTRPLKLKVKGDPRASLPSAQGTPRRPPPESPRTQARLQQTQTAEVSSAERLGVQLNAVLTEPISSEQSALPTWLWWLLGLLGPLTLLGHELWSVFSGVRARSSSGRAQHRAGRVALSRLAQLTEGELDYSALDEVLLHYLESRLSLTLKGLTRESITEQLSASGLSAELIESYSGLCERVDFARFSPSFADGQQGELLRLATEWVKLTESALSDKPTPSKARVSALSILIGAALFCITELGNPQLSHAEEPQAPIAESAQSTEEGTSWAREGNHAFWSGRYRRATSEYQRALERSPEDAGLWYNLGTAYAYDGRLGEAAYALERAALLAPSASIIAEQRAKVHQAVIAEGTRSPGKRRLILPDEVSSAGGALAFLRIDALRAITLSALSLACFGFTVLRRRKRARERSSEELSSGLSATSELRQMRREATLRVGSILLLVFATLSGGAWWAKRQALEVNRGVVITSRVALHRGPGKQYKAEVDIAGAVKLELQGTHEGWRRVKLSDGREGWLRDDEVRALYP